MSGETIPTAPEPGAPPAPDTAPSSEPTPAAPDAPETEPKPVDEAAQVKACLVAIADVFIMGPPMNSKQGRALRDFLMLLEPLRESAAPAPGPTLGG